MPAPTALVLPGGVRFALEFPVLGYEALVSGPGSGLDSGVQLQLRGGAIDVGYAPSALLTAGAMLALSYSEASDVTADVAAYLDIVPGKTRARFFIRPFIGGTTAANGGGWFLGARAGARIAFTDWVTIEPWVQFRYSGLSSGSVDVGLATLTIGVSVALWGGTIAVNAEPQMPAGAWNGGQAMGPSGSQQNWQQPQSQAPVATPQNSGPPTAHLQSGNVALDLRPVSASEVSLSLSRNPAMTGTSFDSCTEARFVGDSGPLTSVPVAPGTPGTLSARIPAGRLPALTRTGRLALELCSTTYPLDDGPRAITDFLQRFASAGGIIDESAAAPPVAPAPGPAPAPPAGALSPQPSTPAQ